MKTWQTLVVIALMVSEPHKEVAVAVAEPVVISDEDFEYIGTPEIPGSLEELACSSGHGCYYCE